MHDEAVAEDRVPERGLLIVPDEVWAVAVRRAEVIGPLLTRQPHRPVSDGTPSDRHYWQQAEDAINTAVALAQDDPAPARQLLANLTALTRSEVTFQRIRDDLIVLGIPDDRLPRTLAEQRARQTPAVPKTAVTS